jgi:flagellar export protein FliJ
MMSPKFSLPNVLDVRHEKVELLEIDLGKLLMLKQKTQDVLESLEAYQAQLIEQLNEVQIGEIDLVKLNLLFLDSQQIGRDIEAVTLQLKKQLHEIDEKRAELVRAKQSEETLQILKRKRREVYEAEQVQLETQALDDIYIARYFHSQRHGA